MIFGEIGNHKAYREFQYLITLRRWNNFGTAFNWASTNEREKVIVLHVQLLEEVN